MFALSALTLLSTLVAASFYLTYWWNDVIRRASPTFLMTACVGAVIGAGACVCFLRCSGVLLWVLAMQRCRPVWLSAWLHSDFGCSCWPLSPRSLPRSLAAALVAESPHSSLSTVLLHWSLLVPLALCGSLCGVVRFFARLLAVHVLACRWLNTCLWFLMLSICAVAAVLSVPRQTDELCVTR